jgi:hypothetical protein
MSRWTIGLFCGIAAVFCVFAPVEAGLRTPGKYCGVVIFDRWGGCTLYSGIYVMYVSEKTKQVLRECSGKPVQIDAQEIHQPLNPGDGRISKLKYLGAALKNQNSVPLDSIHLVTSVAAGEDGKAVGTITVLNKGEAPVEIQSQELALTLLKKRKGPAEPLWASDGPSFALITRQSFEINGSTPRVQAKGVEDGEPYSWSTGKENVLPHSFTLAPMDKKQVRVRFEIPDGEYDLLCGYGGGVHEEHCLASNLSAFDVKDGKATAVVIKDR